MKNKKEKLKVLKEIHAMAIKGMAKKPEPKDSEYAKKEDEDDDKEEKYEGSRPSVTIRIG